MNIILCDNGNHLTFAPLTLTRAVGDLRIGLFTQAERWATYNSSVNVGYETEAYLSGKYARLASGIKVNAAVIPNLHVLKTIESLKDDEALFCGDVWIAGEMNNKERKEYTEELVVLNQRWDLFKKNGQVLQSDFEMATNGKSTVQLSSTNTIIGDANKIFLEEGAKVEASILNTTNGPIYIGKDAEIMEGSIVRGPFGMKEKSALKMGAKIYGPTTLGPHCKVGGEVNNSIFQAYSNKGHDGFLGNSLIGEWCNLGADTNTSNLKNNYGKVKTYSYQSKKLEQTDEQFMGLVMGDHSKSGINTMFNTATVVGVSTNVFGAEFPPKYLSSFQWGQDNTVYSFEKAIESANNMMLRRGLELSPSEVQLMKYIFDNK